MLGNAPSPDATAATATANTNAANTNAVAALGATNMPHGAANRACVRGSGIALGCVGGLAKDFGPNPVS